MVNQFPQLKNYRFPKDILKNRDWYEKSWAGVLFSLYAIGYGAVYLINKHFKDAWRISITFIKDDEMSWLWDMRDIRRIRDRLLQIIKKKPQIIKGYLKKWQHDWKNFKRISQALDGIDLTTLSDRALQAQHLKLHHAYNQANSVPYLVDSFLTSGENDWLAELIISEIKNQVPADQRLADVATLTAPIYNSFSNRELIDLLKLAVKFEKNKTSAELRLALKNHAAKYYWIENSYYPKKSLGVDYFATKLKKIWRSGPAAKFLREEGRRVGKNKLAKQKLLKKLRISDDLKKIIAAGEIFAKWQDDRKSNVFIANHNFFRILKEVGRRTGLKPFEMYYTTGHELGDIILKHKFDRRRLRARRKNGCLVVNTPQGITLLEGREAKKYSKEYFLGVQKNLTEIRGVAASPGQVTGKARVITKMGDFKKFQTGEILVTNNTTPDFVPIMKKAAAVITEQGGITTHAAIVSRELGVPCIIGTKIATKILKTGDLIEVDADRGIIIIKK